jgi:methyl-accepting chemotaxis protein
MAKKTSNNRTSSKKARASRSGISEIDNLRGQIEAINKSQAVIEFNMDGTIITANDNFLSVVGYTLNEIQGQHHSMFVEPEYKASPEYRQFWEALNRGEYQAAEYKRLGKGGKEVWILASYNPIMDKNGTPFKVVKFASDVTEQKMTNANYQGQIDGINKSQAVIEFNLDGTIITANDNFLSVLGYSLNDIKGRHHSMFVEPEYKASPEYRQFWEALNRGEHQTGEFKRVGNGGKTVWIQASYTPIADLNGKPYKVVKFATDITEQKLQMEKQQFELENILKSVGTPMFVTDDKLIVQSVNEAALVALGYTRDEVVGKMTCAEMCKTEICGTANCTIKNCMKTGEIITGEVEATSRDGKKIPVAAVCSALFDKDGKPYGGMEVIVDQTEQKGTVREVTRLIEAARNGKLNDRAETEGSTGDYKILREGLNQLLDVVDGALSQVYEATDQVSTAATQVSAASQSLAEGATEQAASLEETSSALEEMSAMTKQNADNAQQANTLSTEAKNTASKGTTSMDRMNSAIQEIQKSSDETAKIIKVIDEIAFQTNLLALNAAVEAARAGEAGKGFAVVAEEVRNLAMRSAEAAKNTANMIEESVKNSKNGVDIASEVGKVLEEIVQGIDKTSNLVSEIAAASAEQAQGIDQVNTSVTQMDKVTQQNAANAEESASASEEMSSQAESLKEMLSKFTLTYSSSTVQNNAGSENSQVRKPVNKTQQNQKMPPSNDAFHKIAANAIPMDDEGSDDKFDEFNA